VKSPRNSKPAERLQKRRVVQISELSTVFVENRILDPHKILQQTKSKTKELTAYDNNGFFYEQIFQVREDASGRFRKSFRHHR
jgi:hypothetical protein